MLCYKNNSLFSGLCSVASMKSVWQRSSTDQWRQVQIMEIASVFWQQLRLL